MLENEKAQFALDAVCCEIRADPEGYDQGSWGNGAPDCETPGCIAGYLVATTSTGREAYERLTKGMGPDDGTGNGERGDALRQAATEALGLEQPPRLFEPDWPTEWLEAAGLPPGSDVVGLRVEPGPDTALAVMSAIIDGDLDEALEPSTGFGDSEQEPKNERPAGPADGSPAAD